MKRVLFISKSRLSHNLMDAIRPLVPFKINLRCADSVEEALRKPVSSFPLLIIDWNALAGQGAGELTGLPVCRILLHPHTSAPSAADLHKWGIRECHAKPLLTAELAGIIIKWCRR